MSPFVIGQKLTRQCRGLDNAGKTTIVKKIMGEDVNTVSPTLGFIIKTIDYEGLVFQSRNLETAPRQTRAGTELT